MVNKSLMVVAKPDDLSMYINEALRIDPDLRIVYTARRETESFSLQFFCDYPQTLAELMIESGVLIPTHTTYEITGID